MELRLHCFVVANVIESPSSLTDRVIAKVSVSVCVCVSANVCF